MSMWASDKQVGWHYMSMSLSCTAPEICRCASIVNYFPTFSMQAEGEDSLKKMQLMELAILNGTYRDANIKSRKYYRTVVSFI